MTIFEFSITYCFFLNEALNNLVLDLSQLTFDTLKFQLLITGLPTVENETCLPELSVEKPIVDLSGSIT